MISGTELQHIYQTRFGGRLSYRDRVWQTLILDYFQPLIPAGATVLDLGAGYGEFINNVGCGKKYAMDLNPDTKKRVTGDTEVLLQDCSQPWPLADATLDVIFTSNFLEHLPDTQTLTRTLSEAKRCLKKGGQFIAMGPNIKYVPGAYWDYIDHHLPLTELSLGEALTHQGFSIERSIDKFLPFTMASGPHYPTICVSLYLRFPLAWRIFGKQFLVVAKKSSL